MKSFELLRIKPWDRNKYHWLFTKTELQKLKLLPAPNAKPRAIVERPKQYGGDYFLYTIELTIPYQKTVAQKKHEARLRKERTEKKTRIALRQEKLAAAIALIESQEIPEQKLYETVVIDFETTGLNPNEDEILQVSIIDQDENVLINQLCRPIQLKSWYAAERVHGISSAMVKRKPSFLDIAPKVAQILSSAREVIAYNSSFEAGFLAANGISSDRISWGPDPMDLFADLHNDGQFAKLTDAAAEYGYTFAAHDALEDIKATLLVHKKLQEELKNSEVTHTYDR